MTHDDGEPVPTGGDDYTPYGDAPPPSEALTALRLRAESLVRDENDAALLDLRESLHDDRQWYAHLWGPSLAVAASRVGRDDAIDLLRESVVAGFSQPEMFEGALEKCFATDPAWPQLVDDMAANVPEPRFVFFDWPCERPAAPLVLDRIGSERVAAFTDRLPERTSSAWETALTLLEWARTSWEHANDHVLEPDALGVLERVDAGARFACVEYSIVLSQALNAAGIPGRRVSLRQHNHHVAQVVDMSCPRRGSTTSTGGSCSTGRTGRTGSTRGRTRWVSPSCRTPCVSDAR
jgi:hypothetical protein